MAQSAGAGAIKRKTPREKRIRKLKRNRLIKAVVALVLTGLFGLSVGIWAITRNLPNPAEFGNRAINQSTKIFDRTGTVLLYEIHGEERRTVIPFDQISDTVKKATLAAEDVSFYSHPAFDWRAILRAVWHNVTRKQGESIQGGSTITQQLVKNAFLTKERSITRKIRELILAIRFERRYSKDEILSFYLNQIPYGANAYGIEAASQTYFKKHASDLTLGEAALLAALPKSPSYYTNHPDELFARQRYILKRMAEEGFITQSQLMKAEKEKLAFNPAPPSGIRAPHFVLYVKQLLEDKYGQEMVEKGGLKVTTTLDWDLQQLAERIVEEGAIQNETKWQASNAALMAEDPKTGQILAMVGSRDYFGTPKPDGCMPGLNCKFDPQVNAAMRLRQPGSAFKPFVYYTAFQKGYTPDTVIFDLPTEFSAENPKCPRAVDYTNTDPDCYHPQNYDGTFRGPVTLRKALAQSLNVPSVKVLYLAGIEQSVETGRNFGITTFDKNAQFYGLSLVLGGGGVKLSDLLHAYTVLADDGMLHLQTPILEIKDSQNNILESYEDHPKRIADPNYVRMVNDILSDSKSREPVFPAGALDIPGYRVAAKTGTSQDSRDAWVFGYTPTLAAGVWVGNNDNSPMDKGGAGISAAGPLWRAFMQEALPRFNAVDFPSAEIARSYKPMLSGNYIITGASGMPEVHSILYYVDKDNPLGPIPSDPGKDPQFQNWEYSVLAWAKDRNLTPEEPIVSPTPSPLPEIVILEPSEGSTATSDELKISAQILNFPSVERVSFFFNGSLIARLNPTSDNLYTLYFVPQSWRAQNEIRIEAVSGRTSISAKRIIIR